MRSERALFVVLVGMGTAGFVVVRDGDAVLPIVWPTSTVTMVIQESGSDDVGDGSDLAAIRNGLAVWSGPSCSDFAFVDGGTSPTRGDAADGVNRVSFLESNWPAAAAGAVALTTRRRNEAAAPDEWSEADIILNGQDYHWATDGNVQAYDIQTTVTHELGHVLGLAHTPNPEATMYFGGWPGQTLWRTLHADDQNGVCFLYPAGTFQCTADAQCPLFDGAISGGADTRTHCDGGACLSGPVGYGEACFLGSDCATAQCVKGLDQAPDWDPGFCSESCTPGTCPGGDLCSDVLGPSVCFLGYDDCATHDDCPGGDTHRCTMDLDGRFRCVYRCLTTELHCTAEGGAICHGGTGQDPPGYCRVPGSGATGHPCENGLDCQSLYCSGAGVQPTCASGAMGPDGGPSTDGATAGDPLPPTDFRFTDPGSPVGSDGSGVSAPAAPGIQGGCACRDLGTDFSKSFWGCLVGLLGWQSHRRSREGRHPGRARTA